MLKVFLGFVVSVVVLLSSAYVPRMISGAYATSASVLMTQIQAGGMSSATQEYIVLYNNSSEEVDISGWCLTNKTGNTIICFNPPGVGHEIYLPSQGHAVIASSTLAITLPVGTVTATYLPISQTSGSMTGSSDTISLLNHLGGVVDRQAWTVPIGGGMQFERHATGSPLSYQDTDTNADWSVTPSALLSSDETEIDMSIIDVCPNIDGIQQVVPTGKELNKTGDCTVKVIIKLIISEILPNAIGSDVDREFIELFNLNDTVVALTNYKLYVGLNYEAAYDFPVGAMIQPHMYRSFTNTEIPFTLLNSSSRVGIALVSDNSVVSESLPYVDPKDGQSWALINNEWQYTNQPTPGHVNLIYDDQFVGASGPASVSVLQICAANQYRSPETNRCRLMNTSSGTVTLCKDGQYRSEETSRCRNISSDANVVSPCGDDEERNIDTNRCRKVVAMSTPIACKGGQERSLDTNRCRTVTKMPIAGYGVLDSTTKSGSSWYVWAAVGGILILALGYAVWEWHDEIGKFSRHQYRRVLKFAQFRK